MDHSLSFSCPQWLWILTTIPVISVVSLRSLAGLDRKRRILAVALRSGVIVVLTMALARVECVRRNDNLAVLFVHDRSKSNPDQLRHEAQACIRRVSREVSSRDFVGAIGFDGDASVDFLSPPASTSGIAFGLSELPDRTDISQGMRLALAVFPEGYARRVVLITDGNENAGDVSKEIEALIANNVAVDVMPIRYAYDNEILIDRLSVPSHVSKDTQSELRLIARSDQPTRARLHLYHNDRPIHLEDPVVSLSGHMKPDLFKVPVDFSGEGIHRFDARLTPLHPYSDTLAENNRGTAFAFAEDPGRVLVLSQAGSDDDRSLVQALARENIDVELHDRDRFNVNLLGLQQYSAVILANVSADNFTESQQQALASYVRDVGGGLIMTGGDQAFGAGGWIGSPVEEVSPVSFSIPNRKYLPSAALVLVLDRSGSMSQTVDNTRRTQQTIANESAVLALRTLLPSDQIGVVAFCGGPEWLVKLQPNSNPQHVTDRIRSMSPGGGTNIYPALEYAYHALAEAGEGPSIKHVILLTDGQSTGGPYAELVQKMTSAGITLSTIGVGDGVNDNLLYSLAKKGGGRYHPVHNAHLLPQVFFRETGILRRRLISEKRFTPRTAALSRILGGFEPVNFPPLGGLVLTRPKSDITMPLTRANDDGAKDPVFAHWQYEMGKVAVFTSGLWSKWGADWVEWDGFDKFWSQAVQWVMRDAGSADFDIMTHVEGNRGKVVIEALQKDTSYLNFLQIRGRLTLPNLKSQPITLSQTGPGRYEASFEVHDSGNYLLNLRYMAPGGASGMVRTGLSVPYSPEYRHLQTNDSLLTRIVEQSGGRMLAANASAEDVFSRQGLKPSVSRQPVWQWVVTWLLLPLFLLDIASRRLASTLAFSIYVELAILAVMCGLLIAARAGFIWYLAALILAECVGWAIRWRYFVSILEFVTSPVVAMAQAEQRSGRSIRQLGQIRRRVREDMDRAASTSTTRWTETSEPTDSSASAKTRFEADEYAADGTIDDLNEALNDATQQQSDDTSEPDDKTKPGSDASDTMKRLRKAKRRAWEE